MVRNRSSLSNGPVTGITILAHNNARNPRLSDNYRSAAVSIFDFRNNVIYDYGEIASA